MPDTDHERTSRGLQKWSIEITREERDEITLGAKKAGLTIRAFLMTQVRSERRRDPRDWALGLQYLEAIERRLSDIAAAAPAETALDVISALLSLEREVEHMAKPWMATVAPPAPEKSSC